MVIKETIKAHGYTQKDVADALGIHYVTLQQNLSRNPTIATLRKIASVIGCPLGEFFADEMPEDTASQSPFACPHCGKQLTISLQAK